MNPIVSVRDLCVDYGDVRAVSHVSFDVFEREVLALIGPSGCGKTTLLKALNRTHELADVRPSTRGQVRVLGADIYSPSVAVEMVRQRVGMVFQRPNPLPLTIRDNVLFARRRTQRNDETTAMQLALERVGLWQAVKNFLDAPASELPLDEQQLLCIARLLPTHPTLLLFDEPCSALDPRATARIESLITELGESYPIVIVTHNLAQARRIARRTALMWLGEMVEISAELFKTPRDPRTAAYTRGDLGHALVS